MWLVGWVRLAWQSVQQTASSPTTTTLSMRQGALPPLLSNHILPLPGRFYRRHAHSLKAQPPHPSWFAQTASRTAVVSRLTSPRTVSCSITRLVQAKLGGKYRGSKRARISVSRPTIGNVGKAATGTKRQRWAAQEAPKFPVLGVAIGPVLRLALDGAHATSGPVERRGHPAPFGRGRALGAGHRRRSGRHISNNGRGRYCRHCWAGRCRDGRRNIAMSGPSFSWGSTNVVPGPG